MPIALEDIPDESVIKDRGGIATLLNSDGPAALEPPGKADPERHCVEAALRTGGTEPTLDSESGQLILLKVAKVV